MVVSDSRPAGDVSPGAQQPIPARVVWHDLECGGYRADLPLWRELAERAGGSTLDVGAGSGRVSLDLARAGIGVTALDVDPVLLAALAERAQRLGLSVATVCADARSFSLARRDYALCVVPMQTIQLLGGAEGRVAFLRCAREHLRPGATLACAILASLEPFDCSQGTAGPAAERIELGRASVPQPRYARERACDEHRDRTRAARAARSPLRRRARMANRRRATPNAT